MQSLCKAQVEYRFSRRAGTLRGWRPPEDTRSVDSRGKPAYKGIALSVHIAALYLSLAYSGQSCHSQVVWVAVEIRGG